MGFQDQFNLNRVNKKISHKIYAQLASDSVCVCDAGYLWMSHFNPGFNSCTIVRCFEPKILNRKLFLCAFTWQTNERIYFETGYNSIVYSLSTCIQASIARLPENQMNEENFMRTVHIWKQVTDKFLNRFFHFDSTSFIAHIFDNLFFYSLLFLFAVFFLYSFLFFPITFKYLILF